MLLSSGRAQPCLHSKLRREIWGRLVALLCPLSVNVLLSLKESTRDFYENELLGERRRRGGAWFLSPPPLGGALGTGGKKPHWVTEESTG